MSVGTSTSIFWGRCGACIKNRQNFHIEHIYIYLSVLYIISIIIKISKFFQCYCVSCIINFNQYAGNSLINNYYKFKNISLKSIKIMRRQSQQNISQITQISSDDECCSATTTSTAQILERVQSDKVTVTKPEEDRRRRTIIVEKKNGTFGFTIQSYGIHYKKEKEIEMITYVDYVDYDGPAYRAGMREGDVILSINGTDMEKADHKTLVNYIKKCDTRMRMVVLFEDCVRKVELHMRYIKLQNILETKMDELECLCIKERQLLEGKWKTHSLPARKKASHNNGTEPSALTPQGYYTFCRPTVSTEDVGKIAAQRNNKEPSTPPVVFTYQYLDNNYRYMLQPSTSSSGEYLLTFEPQRRDHHQGFIVKTPCDSTASINKQQYQQSSSSSTTTRSQQQYQENNKAKKGHGQCYSYGGHLCNPCININNNNNPSNNNGDNTSLDAYDLASPCCDPHCIPGARRKSSRTQKNNNPQQIMRKRESKTETTQTDPQLQHQQQQRVRPHSQIASNNTHQNFTSTSSSSQQSSSSRRYFQMDTAAVAAAGLMSQCSLHSCTSSEISNNINPATSTNNVGAESIISANSYTTSLSTDTLYWDGSNADTVSSSRQLLLTPKSTSSTIITERFPQQQNHQLYSSSSHHHNNHHQHHHHHHHQEPIYVQYGQVQAKPKSWDNLTTKSFGGYGFGYGYIEANNKGNNLKTNTNPRNPPANNKQNNQQIHQYVRVIENSSKGIINIPQYTPHTQRRWQPSNKSTESLLSIPKYSNENISDNNSINNSSSCECFEPVAAAASSSSSASSPHHPAHHSPPPPPPSEGGNNECRFFHPTSRQSILSPTTADPNLGYYSIARNKPSKSVENSNNQLQASASINHSEATRL